MALVERAVTGQDDPAPEVAAPDPAPAAEPSPVPAPVTAGRRAPAWTLAGVSLSVLVPGVATVILAASMLFAAYVAEQHSRRLLVRESEARLVSEGRQLALAASTAMLDDFPELRLAPAVREFAAGRRDLAAIVITDGAGVIQGDLDARRIGTRWTQDPSWKPAAPVVPLRAGERLFADARTFVVMTPVLHAGGRTLGTATVAVRRDVLERALEDSRRAQGAPLLFMLVAGALAMALLMFGLVSPVAEIRRGVERIGRGDFAGRLRARGAAEFRMLSRTLNAMVEQLRAAREQELERLRLTGEMEVAARIHRALLPAGRFRSGDFVMVGAQRTATEVGGDYFDYLTRPDGRVAVVMADVAGKGVGGALVMSMFASLLRAFGQRSETPSSLLVTIEKHLGPHLERTSFITVWTAVLDPDNGRVVHASAGHLPTLIVRAGGGRAEWVRARAVPIGVAGPSGLQAQVEDSELVLHPGDLLVQLTDGITEAMRPGDRQQFGFQRVEQAVLECASLGPDAVVKGVLQAVSRWTSGPAQDDETLLVIGRSATAEAAESPTPFSVHDLMALAESYGHPAPPIASLADLGALRGWMSEHGIMGSLPDPSRRRIELGLYEMCANVIEHGYRRNENAALDLWWVPDDPALGAGRPGVGPPPSASAGVRTGYFVLRDHGRPFDPGRGPTPDLRDAAIRRTGRGLGLEMARRILSRLRYYPNSPYGNLTLMRFDNDSATEGDHV